LFAAKSDPLSKSLSLSSSYFELEAEEFVGDFLLLELSDLISMPRAAFICFLNCFSLSDLSIYTFSASCSSSLESCLSRLISSLSELELSDSWSEESSTSDGL